MMTGIISFKVTALDFEGKLLLSPNCGKWNIFGPKDDILKFSQNFFVRFLLMVVIKKWFKNDQVTATELEPRTTS